VVSQRKHTRPRLRLTPNPGDRRFGRGRRQNTVDQRNRHPCAAVFRLVKLHPPRRLKPAVVKHHICRRHHSAAVRICEGAILPHADLSATHPVVGPFNIDVFKVRSSSLEKHRIEPAQKRNILVHMLVSGSLKSHRLCNDIRSLLEILARVARVLVICIAVIEDRQIFYCKARGINKQNISIVLCALHEPAIVREHHGPAIVSEAQERDVVFRNVHAGCSRRAARELIYVRLDSDDGRLCLSSCRRRSICGLQSPELSITRVVLRQVPVDQQVIG
jgi:hypothetical protein